MKSYLFRMAVALLAMSLVGVTAHAAPVTIVLIGDSTMCNYPEASRQRGWGQLLPEFLTSDTKVINLAKAGASTKTFPAKLWAEGIAAKPDFILIQFGHNDSHAKEKPESTDAATDYRDNLCRYVREAREAGAEPVLITPVRRRLFRSNGNLSTELARYAEAMKAVATEMDVKRIDLHETSGELYTRLGEKGSDAFTMNQPDNADRPGNGDRTHFTAYGARAMAELVAADFKQIDERLSSVVVTGEK